MKSYEKGISLSIWTLSWPIFIEVFLQLLVGNIDQVMMSHYSPQAVAAVANANHIYYAHYCYEYSYDDFDCPVFRGSKSV